jgi:hypothetical protein
VRDLTFRWIFHCFLVSASVFVIVCSSSVMRSTFSSIMHKRIYTLNFDRASEPDPNMYRKLQNAIRTMGVVISTPTAVKSVMLKYIEVRFGGASVSRFASSLVEFLCLLARVDLAFSSST